MAIKQKIMLDVGCSTNKQHGFIGMDKRKVEGVDIEHDAETIPWPLENGSCAVVMMSHLIEHIKPWCQIEVMNEVWRVLEPEGVLMISTPYGRSYRYFQDPTHCTPWVEATPEYFDPQFPLYQVYQPKPWTIEKRYWDLRGDIELVLRKIDDKTKQNKMA